MARQKPTHKLLVKTPVTPDGLTIKLDGNSQVVYKETLLPLKAKAFLEEENRKLSDAFKHKFSTVAVDERGNRITDAAAPAEDGDAEKKIRKTRKAAEE